MASLFADFKEPKQADRRSLPLAIRQLIKITALFRPAMPPHHEF